MRTQQEILAKIKEIEATKTDPTGVQVKLLTYKLTWENARPFITEKYRDDIDQKNKWKKTCRMDEKALKIHVQDHMDVCASDFFADDLPKCLVNIQVFIILIWLHGPKKDHFLGHVIREFMTPKTDGGLKVFKMIAEEFGISWKLMELRYNRGSSLILPPQKPRGNQ